MTLIDEKELSLIETALKAAEAVYGHWHRHDSMEVYEKLRAALEELRKYQASIHA